MASRVFAVFLVIMAGYRLTLLDRGATAFVDETLYFTSVMALQSFAVGDVRGGLRHIAAARGRQGAELIQLPLAALQAIPSAFGIPASNLRSLLIPAVFNVVISLVTLFLFFKVCLVLSHDGWAALAASVVYGLLVNTNLYCVTSCHDWALLLGVYALWLALTRPPSPWLALVTGALTGMMITFYTGITFWRSRWASRLAVRSSPLDGGPGCDSPRRFR